MLELRQCGPLEYEFVRFLRLHEDNRSGFWSQDYIDSQKHFQYMETTAKDCYWICCRGDELLGYYAVVDNDVKICVHPDCKREGVGSFMLKDLERKYPNALAKVLKNNKASLALFRKHWQETNSDKTWVYFRKR